MPSASGTISAFGTNFLGTFNPPQGMVKVTGSFSSSVPLLTVSSASVTFNSFSDLVGPYDIIIKVPPSFIGTTSIDLLFRNPAGTELHVTGNLDEVTPSRITIAGYGIWTPVGV
jgi:hypothetical protein